MFKQIYFRGAFSLCFILHLSSFVFCLRVTNKDAGFLLSFVLGVTDTVAGKNLSRITVEFCFYFR